MLPTLFDEKMCGYSVKTMFGSQLLKILRNPMLGILENKAK